MQDIKKWLEIRLGVDDLIRTHLTEYRVPGNLNLLYTLGAVALILFGVQVITGFFLLIYYIPDSDKAFRSVQDIMSTVPYGWLFRQIHVVGSTLMVVLVFLHMMAVFLLGGYKKPRELTWVAGSVMLLCTIVFCLSGYLLPWSQLSYWATTIATTIPTAFPYIGEWSATLMKGSQAVSGVTLNRFFAIHVMLLPLALITLVGVHLFLVRRIGISSPPFGSAEPEKPWTEYRHESYPQGSPFFPDFVLKETIMAMIVFAVMFFIISLLPTLLLPEEANIPADPFRTPAHIKPEWYFLAPYQMLKTIPNKFLGISLQMLFVLAFILWPFLDTKEEKNLFQRPRLLGFFTLGIILWVVFTIWGKLS